MTSVNSNLSGSYYDLNSSSSKQTQTGKAQSAPSLADYLGQGKTADSKSSNNSAYSLDLSPEAQNYLKGSSGSSFASANGFQLTNEQKNKIQSILEKYKDAPYTQETYEKIQNDLEKAGVSPQKLALLDNAKNFSTTKVLIAALTGQSADDAVTPWSFEADQKSNSESYMDDIVKQWKALSSTAKATSGA
jgi:hypothetical protein